MDYNYCYQFRIGDDRMIHCCPIFWARLEAFGHFVIDDAETQQSLGDYRCLGWRKWLPQKLRTLSRSL
jgi:hypothetical protein